MIRFYQNLYQKFAEALFRPNPYTWVYGLTRSILALGTLITLAFSSVDVLFDDAIFHEVNAKYLFSDFNFFMIFGWDHLGLAKAIAMVILLLTASGLYPRMTGLLQWWIASSFFYSSSIIEGGDQINAIICLLLVPLTLLDNRRWHWETGDFSENKRFVGNLAFVLITVQMAMVYLNAASDKIYAATEEWKLGNAFYYYVNDSYFAYPDWMDPLMEQLLANSFIVSSLTWGTILLELVLFGVLFSNKRVKFALFPIAAIFHLGIAIFLGLVSFFMAMLAGLIIYLVPKDLPPPKILRRWGDSSSGPVPGGAQEVAPA
ncbi:MAG: sporulation-delaying protein SdpB family protein [Bacteroidota bacterium]